MLDYLTFVSLRSHFAETNLISLSLLQLADFVCKLKRRCFHRLFSLCLSIKTHCDAQYLSAVIGKYHAAHLLDERFCYRKPQPCRTS